MPHEEARAAFDPTETVELPQQCLMPGQSQQLVELLRPMPFIIFNAFHRGSTVAQGW